MVDIHSSRSLVFVSLGTRHRDMVPARTSLFPGVSCNIPTLVVFKPIDQHERTAMRQRDDEQEKKRHEVEPCKEN